MRARLTAIVLSMFLGLGVLALTAGSAWASTPTPTPALAPAPTAGPSGHLSHAHLASVAHPDVGGFTAQGDESGAAQSIHGTVRGPAGEGGANEPIPGVKITVEQDGKAVGTATTDNKGEWSIPIPKPGEYQVTLDVSTLPPSVQLRNANGETLPGLNVQPGSTKVAIFPLVKAGEGAGSTGGGGSGQLAYYLGMLVAGLRYGVIIAMTAVGLSLIFGTTGLINFAHGEMVTIGAVVAYVFGTSPLQWPFIVAVILAIIAVGFLGGLIEFGLWRPLRKRGTGLIQMFIISIGLSLLLRHAVLYFFGSNRSQYQQATIQTPMHFGALTISARDLTLILISAAVLIGVALMLQHTRMGKSMRALSDNRDLAEASGIDVQRVILQVWILGGGLAALGGVFFGLTTSVYWNMGWYLLLLMFAGVILGGLGSAYGAMLGSIVVGIVAQFSTVWFPSDLQNAWAMLVLVVVLLVRPQGILGRLQRAG